MRRLHGLMGLQTNQTNFRLGSAILFNFSKCLLQTVTCQFFYQHYKPKAIQDLLNLKLSCWVGIDR